MNDPANSLEEASRVVVVDDDNSVCQALRRLLRSAGFDVSTYPSATEFLRSIDLKQPTCLVLDIQMPGLTGLELQKVLSTMNASMPIIFMTAHRDEDVRARAIEMGAVGFLEKPFDDNALISLIRNALSRFQTPGLSHYAKETPL